MPALGLEEGKMEALMKLMLESNQKMESRIQQIESRIEEIHQETKDCLYEIYKALPGAAAAKRTPAFHNKLDFDSAKDEEKRRELEEVKRQEKMFKDQEEAKSKERILQELEDKKKKQELLHLQLIVEDKIFSTMAGDKKAGGGDKKKEAKKKEVKKETGLGLSIKKDENFGEWYSEVVVKSKMIEYHDISGCYNQRPWATSIWKFFDAEIKKLKVQNCNYSLFVSESALQKEKDHVEGFAPEVAWVTKSGKSELEKPIAIRPTSETIMYPSYAKQIRSHHDLPLKLNQWCNVVRWEFSNPTPFIRSREFLWQEGHTAFATKEEADEEVLQILELYRRIYEEFLAIPVIKGKKSENEKFAGGLYTTSVEAYIPHTGRAVQGATSHCLGQNFAKMFEISFENDKGESSMVWQNSWAYSTRTIGVMVMVHGDDKGLVLPPKVASVQVIVVPVPYKDANTQGIYDACKEVVKALCDAGIRAETDFRDNYSPGFKYAHWEMKGVPLRIEIGPKDLANKQVRVVRRHNSTKVDIGRDILVEQVKGLLDDVQQSMFDAAKEKRDACVQVVKTWDEFIEALNQKKMILAPWCDEQEVEQDVKNRTRGEMGAAKTLCTPFEQPELPEGTKCFASDKIAKKWTYWGRSY